MMRTWIVLVLLLGLTACNQQGEGDVDSASTLPIEGNVDQTGNKDTTIPRMYLKNASMGDYAPYMTEDKDGLKVVICHVLPGNPFKFKTHIVSINALQAHLNHGGGKVSSKSKKPGHSHGHGNDDCKGDDESDDSQGEMSEAYLDDDYLGSCGAPEPKEDIIIIDDPVYPADGVVCEGLRGDELFACLAELDQDITVEL